MSASSTPHPGHRQGPLPRPAGEPSAPTASASAEQALAECAQSVPDPVAQRRSADLQVTITEIDAALARIDAGTYGACTRCGSAIPEERLELRPFASRCVACTSAG